NIGSLHLIQRADFIRYLNRKLNKTLNRLDNK
ncbi:MAG: hypothetical protein ACI85S_002848, partial [Pseudohongiellaceae bacterium]